MKANQGKESHCLTNLVKQIKIFYLRIQISSQTSEESDVLLSLGSHINLLQHVSSTTDITKEFLTFSQSLESNENLAACFLTQFMNYVQSTFDLEGNLDKIKEIINYLLPCIHAAMKRGLEKHSLNKILNRDLALNLYKCAINAFKRESLYQEGAAKDMLEYQSNQDRIVKAHIVRMNSGDSKVLFQETSGDRGNIADLYLIYIWQIYMIYEIKEEILMQPSVCCLTQVMEKSGKYIVVVPSKDLKKMALTDPFSPAGRYKNILTESDKLAAHHPIPDLDFEWTDFRIGVLYPNGVVFLINSAAWEGHLQEISSIIGDLEVKRSLKFLPSPGSTFALPLKGDTSIHKKIRGVRFIRVRVVRVSPPGCHVYGMDTGSFHWCSISDLLLLPASIINLPSCGRLARLPVVPVPPTPSSQAPIVALLAALAQQTDLILSLSLRDIQQTHLWLQVPELKLPTLYLLQALTHSSTRDCFLPSIASVAADYLMRVTEQGQPDQEVATTLISILTLTMQKHSKVSLMLARGGIFTTLCEAAITMGCKKAWICIKVLLGGEQPERKSSSQGYHTSAVHHPARHPKQHQPFLTAATDDTSPTVMQMATHMTPNHNWDLIMQPTFTSPQLASYHSSGKWHWDMDEVVPSHARILEKGHHLGVKTDLTHHLIHERNVSSICSETLLQIILGMLNTHLGGMIYIGLNQRGVVQGVKISREQQDSLMLGFTKLVTSDVYPSLLPCDSLVHFVPVVQPGVTPPPEFVYYLVIFTVQPQPHQVYFSQEHPEKLYMREGGSTLTLLGSRRAKLLSDSQHWTQALEQQVTEEKKVLLQIALSRSQQQ